MNRFFTSALFALFLLAPATLANATSPPPLGERAIEGYQRAAWYMACEVKRFDCTLLRPPMIVYAIIPSGTLGLYPHNSPVVIITSRLMYSTEQTAVLVHEMIHYIQGAQGHHNYFSGAYRPSCAREQEAFDLTLKIMTQYRLKSRLAASWEEMRLQYGCDSLRLH